MSRKKIGEFSSELISALHLDIPAGTPIYIADSNIQHMKSSHPKDFQKYGNDIESIIASPDYVGRNIKDDSIEFTKKLNTNRVKNFIAKGTLKKLDK